jgi:hypothetical protein
MLHQSRRPMRSVTVLRATAFALSAIVVACSGGPGAPAPSDQTPVAQASPSPSPTPTPVPTPRTWPLTGKRADGDVSLRPIAVRFDNATPAQPQAGLNSADVVFDSVIEACVSRLLAVYHSRGADPLGSVRSARLYELQLLPMLRGALAHVGAADEVSQMIRDAVDRGEFVDIDAATFHRYPEFGRFYWRIGWKAAPYNMYSSYAKLREATAAAARGTDPVSVPDWGFLPEENGDAAAGGFGQSVPATAMKFPGAAGACPDGQNVPGYRPEYAPSYNYDAAQHGYRRSTNGRVTIDETTKEPVLARNVVVIYTDLSVTNIVESQGGWGVAYSIMPRTTGGGQVRVYRNGRMVEGSWSRADIFAPFDFRVASGEKILLSPGQTWVHIVPKNWSVQ